MESRLDFELTVACRDCTFAEGIADVGADCTAFSYPYLAACLVPADDGRSSCRLVTIAFQTDRVLDRSGDARCSWDRGRRKVVV